MITTEKVGRFRFANHSAAPSGRSRQAASPAKPAAVIAALPHPLALLACAAICIAADIAIWRVV